MGVRLIVPVLVLFLVLFIVLIVRHGLYYPDLSSCASCFVVLSSRFSALRRARAAPIAVAAEASDTASNAVMIDMPEVYGKIHRLCCRFGSDKKKQNGVWIWRRVDKNRSDQLSGFVCSEKRRRADPKGDQPANE